MRKTLPKITALCLCLPLVGIFSACRRTESVQLENPPVPPVPDAPGKTPAWVPVYPGASPNTVARNVIDGATTVNLSFSTDASVEEVQKFYDAELKKGGFTLTKSETTAKGVTYHGIVAEDAGGKRMVNLSVFTNYQKKTGVSLSYTFPEAKK